MLFRALLVLLVSNITVNCAITYTNGGALIRTNIISVISKDRRSKWTKTLYVVMFTRKITNLYC